MRKFTIYILILYILLFSGCKSINSKYVHENDILYVRSYSPNSGLFYYTDKTGTPKLPKDHPLNQYKIANQFSCKLALVLEQNNKWKYIDKSGDVIIDASEYNYCCSFEELLKPGSAGFKGLAYVCKNDGDTWDFLSKGENGEYIDSGTRFGLINTKGYVVLPVEFEDIIGGLGNIIPYDYIWWVRKNGLWGAINENCNTIIPIKYTEVTLFERGIALVKNDGYWGFINKKGKTIFPFSITEYKQFGTSKFQSRTLAKQHDYWGILNEKGKVISLLYFSLPDHEKDIFIIELDEKFKLRKIIYNVL